MYSHISSRLCPGYVSAHCLAGTVMCAEGQRGAEQKTCGPGAQAPGVGETQVDPRRQCGECCRKGMPGVVWGLRGGAAHVKGTRKGRRLWVMDIPTCLSLGPSPQNWSSLAQNKSLWEMGRDYRSG